MQTEALHTAFSAPHVLHMPHLSSNESLKAWGQPLRRLLNAHSVPLISPFLYHTSSHITFSLPYSTVYTSCHLLNIHFYFNSTLYLHKPTR